MPQKPLDSDIRATIHLLAERGLPATRIAEILAEGDKFEGRLPNVRSIQRLVQELNRPVVPTALWTPASERPSNIRLVLNVIAAVVTRTHGRRSRVTVEEATWIERLAAATGPTFDHFALYVLAREYIRLTSEGQSTAALDHWLAFAPWRFSRVDDERDYGGEEYYAAAIKRGWVDESQFLEALVATEVSSIADDRRGGGVDRSV